MTAIRNRLLAPGSCILRILVVSALAFAFLYWFGCATPAALAGSGAGAAQAAPGVEEFGILEARWNPNSKRVELEWNSVSETQIVGYNVQRKRGPGRWKQINPALVAAKNPGMLFGAVYNFKDAAVKPGKKYKYRIEIVYASGATRVSDVEKVRVPQK